MEGLEQRQQASEGTTSNAGKTKAVYKPFHHNWFLKVYCPAEQRGLWLRFSVIATTNGFRRLAEVRAVFSQRLESKEATKIALKNSFDLSAFSGNPPDSSETTRGIKIGSCELSLTSSRGTIQSKGQSISWDLSFSQINKSRFNLIPEALSRIAIVQNVASTPAEDLVVSGIVRVNEQELHWNSCSGMMGIRHQIQHAHSWIWGHCNTFVDEQGKPANFLFEGMSGRSRIGKLVPSPRFSTFYFRYREQDYCFNKLRALIYTRSAHNLSEWKFQADQGDLSFRGHFKAQFRDFAGLTDEDVEGNLFYSTFSQLTDLVVLVYRRGKLEATFKSNGSAAFELMGREKNPYVPFII